MTQAPDCSLGERHIVATTPLTARPLRLLLRAGDQLSVLTWHFREVPGDDLDRAEVNDHPFADAQVDEVPVGLHRLVVVADLAGTIRMASCLDRRSSRAAADFISSG